MCLLKAILISAYLSSVVISLLLTLFAYYHIKDNKTMKVMDMDIRIKYPALIITVLIILSLVPVLNTIVSNKLVRKILI
jgi:predicted membrane channel-forming protein YqfA (hemolysin III family)